MKSLSELSSEYTNPSICAWCGTRQGDHTQRAMVTKRDIVSGRTRRVVLHLPACTECQSYIVEREKAHRGGS